MREIQLAVVGGGPAGLAAAVEAKKKGISDIVIFERDENLGGILQQCIHSGFGLDFFGEELTGPEYAWRFIDLVRENGIEYKTGTMVISVSEDRMITAVNTTDGLLQVRAAAIVLATGCRERPRGALATPGTRPAGIFTAGTAQRFVNMEGYMPGRKIVILGSGDIGLIMARRMTLEGAEVKMVCEIMPYSSGLARNIAQCLDDFGIPLKLSHTVVKIHGRERLEGVTVAKVDDNMKPLLDTAEYVECDTLLLSVGLIPENELSKEAGIEIDPVTSGPVVNEFMETSIKGIFAAGNSVQVHDLVDNVTREAMLAGSCAADFILKGSVNADIHPVKTVAGKGVRYVVPQLIEHPGQNNVKLFFRVADVFRDISVVATIGGKEVYKRKKKIVTPGEMEHIDLKSELLRQSGNEGDIVLSIY